MGTPLKTTAFIACEKHGQSMAIKGIPTKMVRVPIPTTKKQRLHGGCPHCKREKREG